jgi:hypothetical protein
MLDVDVIRNKINENFRYFFENFLFLPPNLTRLQTDDVYGKFTEFYVNGDEVLSQQNTYQLIEVSNPRCTSYVQALKVTLIAGLRLRQGEARVVGGKQHSKLSGKRGRDVAGK